MDSLLQFCCNADYCICNIHSTCIYVHALLHKSKKYIVCECIVLVFAFFSTTDNGMICDSNNFSPNILNLEQNLELIQLFLRVEWSVLYSFDDFLVYFLSNDISSHNVNIETIVLCHCLQFTKSKSPIRYGTGKCHVNMILNI